MNFTAYNHYVPYYHSNFTLEVYEVLVTNLADCLNKAARKPYPYYEVFEDNIIIHEDATHHLVFSK